MKLNARVAAVLVGSVLLLLLLATTVYGATASSSITVSLPINNYISINQPTDVSMPAISGTGGTSTGNATWIVTTNNLLGYSLSVSASAAPAMSGGGYTVPDYTTAVPNVPETWSVAASAAAFGFSAEGNSTSSVTWGTPSTGAGKYRGFDGTNGINVATSILPIASESTTIYFNAEVGSSYMQPSGTYSATVTATALTL